MLRLCRIGGSAPESQSRDLSDMRFEPKGTSTTSPIEAIVHRRRVSTGCRWLPHHHLPRRASARSCCSIEARLFPVDIDQVAVRLSATLRHSRPRGRVARSLTAMWCPGCRAGCRISLELARHPYVVSRKMVAGDPRGLLHLSAPKEVRGCCS